MTTSLYSPLDSTIQRTRKEAFMDCMSRSLNVGNSHLDDGSARGGAEYCITMLRPGCNKYNMVDCSRQHSTLHRPSPSSAITPNKITAATSTSRTEFTTQAAPTRAPTQTFSTTAPATPLTTRNPVFASTRAVCSETLQRKFTGSPRTGGDGRLPDRSFSRSAVNMPATVTGDSIKQARTADVRFLRKSSLPTHVLLLQRR